MHEFGFTDAERRAFRQLDAPGKIQDFLNAMPFNFEKNGDTCMSPRRVLAEGRAQCMEGAMFAAAALRLLGHPPLIVDLESSAADYDHVIAVFRAGDRWGAISKTNHAVLRYREPVYRSLRELVLSYFHEYFLDDGKKTLREYSELFDLSHFDRLNWRTTPESLLQISFYLDKIKHHKILSSITRHSKFMFDFF